MRLWAHPQVPLVRPRVGDDVVIPDGDEGAVVEERDQHQHEHRQLEEGRPLHDGHKYIPLAVVCKSDRYIQGASTPFGNGAERQGTRCDCHLHIRHKHG